MFANTSSRKRGNPFMKFVITGVHRGIGRALAQKALEQGHHVIGTTRSSQSDFNHPHFQHQILDLSLSSSIQSFSQSAKDWGPFDVLINNAGVLLDQTTTFENLSTSQLMDTFQVNAIGPHLITQILLPHLKKSANPVVASISSIMGSIEDNSSGRYYAYRMSKAALNAWNKSFSIDFPQITALVLHPGWVKTEMGGAQAPLAPERSAEGLLKVISTATTSMTGRFFDYRGNELPW
jgi:NAD(P)-dependent dehydrogenase (short-subunit alcohol dehydrogenase family)